MEKQRQLCELPISMLGLLEWFIYIWLGEDFICGPMKWEDIIDLSLDGMRWVWEFRWRMNELEANECFSFLKSLSKHAIWAESFAFCFINLKISNFCFHFDFYGWESHDSSTFRPIIVLLG